jgi:beta-lactamase superfamily II metal-dependent hydrolase
MRKKLNFQILKVPHHGSTGKIAQIDFDQLIATHPNIDHALGITNTMQAVGKTTIILAPDAEISPLDHLPAKRRARRRKADLYKLRLSRWLAGGYTPRRCRVTCSSG